jgi:hypothetical protein
MAPSAVLYVHASAEGAIFVVRPDSSQAWITLAELDAELERLLAAEGAVLFSMEGGREAAAPPAHSLHRHIIGAGPPTRLLPDQHPAVTPLPEGVTRLMAFAHADRADLADDLLERGANADVVDQQGTTPLMYAANSGASSVTEVLLRHGADPSMVALDGTNALMYASQHGFLDIVRLLLAAGADPLFEGPDGLTAMELAEDGHHDLVLAALRLASPR